MMDRALKERVIGAVVLVVFAVLLVPVFLDGPADDAAEVREALTLPGQEEQSGRQKTIVLERDREQPVPAPRPAPEESEEQPTVIVSKESVKPAATSEKSTPPPKPAATAEKTPAPDKPAETAAAATSTTGMWAVQLGSFSSSANAERLAADLRSKGYAAFLSQLRSGDKKLHRVRVGPQKDRAAAESVAAKLNAAGHKGQVVPHP